MSQVVPTGIDQLALMRLAWNDGQKTAALVRQRAAAFGGHAMLVRGSEQVRREIDVFHPQPAGLAALSERVRNSFDPRRILNRGRLVREGA